jgi:hypothetical protein
MPEKTMQPVTDLLLLSCLLSGIYTALGVLSYAFERGVPLLVRRTRRGRAGAVHRTRRRAVRPRRKRGSAMPAATKRAAPSAAV